MNNKLRQWLHGGVYIHFNTTKFHCARTTFCVCVLWLCCLWQGWQAQIQTRGSLFQPLKTKPNKKYIYFSTSVSQTFKLLNHNFDFKFSEKITRNLRIIPWNFCFCGGNKLPPKQEYLKDWLFHILLRPPKVTIHSQHVDDVGRCMIDVLLMSSKADRGDIKKKTKKTQTLHQIWLYIKEINPYKNVCNSWTMHGKYL